VNCGFVTQRGPWWWQEELPSSNQVSMLVWKQIPYFYTVNTIESEQSYKSYLSQAVSVLSLAASIMWHSCILSISFDLKIRMLIPGCERCRCHINGTLPGTTCDPSQGTCQCVSGASGRHCDICDQGFYGERPDQCLGKIILVWWPSHSTGVEWWLGG